MPQTCPIDLDALTPIDESHGRYGKPLVYFDTKYEKTDPRMLTPKELAILLPEGQSRITAYNNVAGWKFPLRDTPQRILDYLYLGPNHAIRDLEFLRSTGITMVLVVRNANIFTKSFASLDRAAATLGIVGRYVDMYSPQMMLRKSLDEAVRIINDHVLSVHHAQCRGGGRASCPTRAKVLITCETGRMQSAFVLAAYLMAVFGLDMADAMRFIFLQRPCIIFFTDSQAILDTWGGILKARASVARAGDRGDVAAKRQLGDNSDDDDVENSTSDHMDSDRFLGRRSFVPFEDKKTL
ncbi:PTPc DSPc [Geosmithia morbida]|uniref:PTPc DSPc n=1 Tax=Geosmithia morbida TaxID=1094350 RepID=A0A9P4YTW4_9HYPO|nr:PTPc DSPc [Geosmithia morbida]KAF4123023.1 PTPc DSPc [Geosmithia morbida]